MFTINGKEYKPAELTFNAVCDMEAMGLSLEKIGDQTMLFARAYFGLCLNGNYKKAGNEIEQHLINGGNLDELVKAMSEAINNSGFFQALNKKSEKKTAKGKAEEKAE